MKRYLSHTGILILVLLASSCASTKYIYMDVLYPARISFPDNVVNVAIVDNAGLFIPDSVKNDTHTEEEKLSSMSKGIFLRHLEEKMNEEKYFNDVVLYPYTIRTDKNYDRLIPMFKSDIQEIASEMDADVVISLDLYEYKNDTKKLSHYGMVYNSNTTSVNLLFKIYDSEGNSKGPAMATSDTVYWLPDAYHKINANTEFAKSLAAGVVKQLIPYWKTEERWYFTDGKKAMKKADKEVKQGNWAEAAKFWAEAFDTSTKNIEKAKIAANIALANENLDDLDNAVEWISLARELIVSVEKTGLFIDKFDDLNSYIYWYRLKLLERQKEKPQLVKQLETEIRQEGEKE